MVEGTGKTESKVEVVKRNSRHLRGTIAEALASDATHFSESDEALLKFHGAYQQDDRDLRHENRKKGVEEAYQFMVRCAIPGGVVSADQYLGLDALSDQYGNRTLRITTRQGFQLHGVIKKNLKATIVAINHTLLTTISACGDVERNVMTCPAPLHDEAHVTLRRVAREIAIQLRPATRAYHEIWLDGEKALSAEQEEPFYGDVYMPRKFKTAIALADDNCVDVYNDDAGLIAILEGPRIVGYNVLVGGGMGMTHGKADTVARLGEPLGFVAPEHAVEAIRTICAIFRDHGNRTDRRHARIKYLINDWGIERFREEFRRRALFDLHDWRPVPRPVCHDHLGRNRQGDGKWFYGVFIENGRIIDRDDRRIKTALREPSMGDRGREDRLSRSPLPPNRAGGSPAHGSPVGGSPHHGLTDRDVGCLHAEQPLRGKESVRPAMMRVPQSTMAVFLMTLEQDAPQAPSKPPIQTAERAGIRGVLEVLKPAPRRSIDRGDDHAEALTVLARRLGA